MNAIDDERSSSAEFSELYLRLLNAVLDEANSSLSPEARRYNLKAHVARGISMAGVVSGSFCNRGSGHGETTFL